MDRIHQQECNLINFKTRPHAYEELYFYSLAKTTSRQGHTRMKSCTSIPWPKQRQNMYHIMISHSGNIMISHSGNMNSRYGKPDHPLPTETCYQDEDLLQENGKQPSYI